MLPVIKQGARNDSDLNLIGCSTPPQTKLPNYASLVAIFSTAVFSSGFALAKPALKDVYPLMEHDAIIAIRLITGQCVHDDFR